LIVILRNTIPPLVLFEMLQVKFIRAVCAFGMKIELVPSCGILLAGTVAFGPVVVAFPNRYTTLTYWMDPI